jgi:hypothetical protein
VGINPTVGIDRVLGEHHLAHTVASRAQAAGDRGTASA